MREAFELFFTFSICGLWHKNSYNFICVWLFKVIAALVLRCLRCSWSAVEREQRCQLPILNAKTTIHIYWEGQDCSHLPVNTMTVWKSAGSGGIQCCVTLFSVELFNIWRGKVLQEWESCYCKKKKKKCLRRNCFGKLGKTLIKSVSLSEKMKRAATMKKVEKTKKKRLRRERKSFMGKIHGKKKIMMTRISDITARRVSVQTPQCMCADTQANLIIGRI